MVSGLILSYNFQIVYEAWCKNIIYGTFLPASRVIQLIHMHLLHHRRLISW